MFDFRRGLAALAAGLLIVLFSSACQSTPIPSTAAQLLPSASPTSQPTLPPSPVEPNVTFQGVQFRHGPADQTASWGGRLVPRSVPDGLPEHIDLNSSAQMRNSIIEGHIFILPASQFEETEALRQFLARRPAALAPGETIPFLPPSVMVLGPQQAFAAQIATMDFQNGTGVRFVTQYQREPMIVTNGSLAYTFQGLTNDGQFYVSVILPIRHPSLRAATNDPKSVPGYDPTTHQYTGYFPVYIKGIADTLNQASPDSFRASLPDLDALVQSLRVEPPSPLASAFTPTPDLPTPTPEMAVTPAHWAPPPSASQGGITFRLDPAVAASWGVTGMFDVPQVNNGTAMPRLYRIDFQNYAIPERSEHAHIFISPTYGLDERENELYISQLEQVRDFLSRRPAAVATGGGPTDDIPRLTLSEESQGVQYFLARIAYMDFQNGTGVRYVTEYTWENWPATNESLQYVYQGLTSDGKYAVSVYLPIRHPYLPDHPATETSQAEREAFLNQYPAYLSGITQTFNTAEPASFTPDIASLDALVQSLWVRPNDF